MILHSQSLNTNPHGWYSATGRWTHPHRWYSDPARTQWDGDHGSARGRPRTHATETESGITHRWTGNPQEDEMRAGGPLCDTDRGPPSINTVGSAGSQPTSAHPIPSTLTQTTTEDVEQRSPVTDRCTPMPAVTLTVPPDTKPSLSIFFRDRKQDWAIPEICADEDILFVTDTNRRNLARFTPSNRWVACIWERTSTTPNRSSSTYHCRLRSSVSW